MPNKAETLRRTVKRLEREESQLLSKHRSLRDVHEHKQTKAVKKETSNVLVKADKLAKRTEKLKGLASGKRM